MRVMLGLLLTRRAARAIHHPPTRTSKRVKGESAPFSSPFSTPQSVQFRFSFGSTSVRAGSDSLESAGFAMGNWHNNNKNRVDGFHFGSRRWPIS